MPLRRLAIVPLICLGVAACGSGGPSGIALTSATDTGLSSTSDNGGAEAAKTAQTIIDDAGRGVSAARSFSIKGTVTTGGDTVSLDVQSQQGGTAAGKVTAMASTVQFIALNQTYWIKSTQLLLQYGGAAAVQAIGNRWIKVSSGQAGSDQFTAGIKTFADGKTLANELLTGISGMLTKKGTSVIDGATVVEVDDSQSQYFITTQGTPELYRIILKGGGGQLDLRDFNKDFGISAPSDSDSVDLGTISGGAGAGGGFGSSTSSFGTATSS